MTSNKSERAQLGPTFGTGNAPPPLSSSASLEARAVTDAQLVLVAEASARQATLTPKVDSDESKPGVDESPNSLAALTAAAAALGLATIVERPVAAPSGPDIVNDVLARINRDVRQTDSRGVVRAKRDQSPPRPFLPEE